MSVYLFATLDTKGNEARLLRDLIRQMDQEVVVVDTGCLGKPEIEADIDRETFYRFVQNDVKALAQAGDRGQAISVAAEAASALIREAMAGVSRTGVVTQLSPPTGVISLGGSAGTTIGTAAMRALPIGIPKVMVSTLASGQVRSWVGDKDIFMLNSVVDIAGVNRISRQILRQAAGALNGAIAAQAIPSTQSERPILAATMFGVTTPCVEQARQVLESAGFEVLVFHATGNGGQAMESLIRDGMIAGVLDMTTTELADELVGGILSAGPQRLTAAADVGIPQVISVGATDMVNFGPPDTVPNDFSHRQFYHHNPTVTLMRTTQQENAQLGREIAEKAASHARSGYTSIMLPLQGVSAIDKAGQPFDDPVCRKALFDSIRERSGEFELIELDAHINDAAFAQAAAHKLIAMLSTHSALESSST